MYCVKILPTEENAEPDYRIGVRVIQDIDGTTSFIRTALEEHDHPTK